MKKIHVNQLGYRTKDFKRAVVAQNDDKFQVVRASDNSVAYDGVSGNEIYDAASEETVRIADFSDFSEKGEYIIRADSGSSYPFLIDETPYKGFRNALLEMFNYQKCGVDLDCGLWSHPVCHDSPATIYGTDEKKDVSGGWHDAGDYGRYIVPAAMTVADLLLAHELSPGTHGRAVPEANDQPKTDEKILETVWFEIEWMLKMQCEKTGGVYHKVSCRTFNALDEMPHDEKGELVICPISYTATADFAAAMALGSRFYPSKKDVLLNSAKRAWDWCMKNPHAPNFTNPPDIKTGMYGDDNNKDEILWAACELFAATCEEKYHDVIKSSEIFLGLGWADMGTYGIAAYLRLANEKPNVINSAQVTKMKNKLRLECKEILQKNKKEPYGTSQGTYYRWGSNLDVANNAKALLLYHHLAEKNIEYEETAMEHMHYLLGRNPLSQSYITGFGSNASKSPHHRPSVAAQAAFPGMVIGGPNSTTPRDITLQNHCEGNPPSKFYVDDKESFASNEVSIYWNSAVYFVASVLNM